MSRPFPRIRNMLLPQPSQLKGPSGRLTGPLSFGKSGSLDRKGKDLLHAENLDKDGGTGSGFGFLHDVPDMFLHRRQSEL